MQSDQLATPSPNRGAASGSLPLEVPTGPGEKVAAVVRHPSGAISLHGPRPSGKPGVTSIEVRPRNAATATTPMARRGLQGVWRIVVFKVVGKLAGRVLEELAERWEEGQWEKRPRGWVRITPQALLAAREGKADLPRAAAADFGPRNLLLLHGTLSTTEGCYAKLVETKTADGRDFFTWARSVYGDAIFGFNHPTVTVPLEENANALLAGLPDRANRFDVITHSRGGLVLRQLVERRDAYPTASRFVLDKAVLVAVPNEGTALASEERWQETVGWLANLLELVPDNPMTLGLGFVAEGIAWLAQEVVGRLRGLAAMDPRDREIALLQAPPGPPANAYSAVVANCEPTKWAARLLDAGVDVFFAGANDLVVPAEGGWRVNRTGTPGIPAGRIGCYGRGGNLRGTGDVHHLNLFNQPATVDFLTRALSGADPVTEPLQPATVLPFRGRFRDASADSHAPGAEPELRRLRPLALPLEGNPVPPQRIPRSDVLQLLVFTQDLWNPNALPFLIASYRNARVIAPFPVRGGEAGQQFRRIIATQVMLRKFVDGAGAGPPLRPQLENFGTELFNLLFPGQVRRLYDEVRSKHAGRRLDLVLTSMIHWINGLPWEFAFDPDRGNFLALEEINFTRNVTTAIPAEEIAPSSARLRVLVASSEPRDLAQLSTALETERIAAAFEPLASARLIEVEELRHATPGSLQHRLYTAALSGRPFDALHFIGHGEFDLTDNEGCLLMEDESGSSLQVDADSLRQILCRRGLRLVFLNACESASGARNNFTVGVAPKLVHGGIPTVVANQYKVLDSAAVVFAHHFYLALAQGAPIGDSAREARVAVNYTVADTTMDWGVPVVFAQNPRESLCEPLVGRPAHVALALPTVAAANPPTPRGPRRRPPAKGAPEPKPSRKRAAGAESRGRRPAS